MEHNAQHTALAQGTNLAVSWKFSFEVARFIRGKDLETAKKLMQGVTVLDVAVPFRRYDFDLAHKRGGIGPGRFPVKAAKAILEVLESAEMNAINKGLDQKKLYVQSIVTNKGTTVAHGGRLGGRRAKRTHIAIVLAEREEKKEKKGKKK